MTALTYSSLNFGTLAVLPYAPSGDAQETLEFYTDVLASHTAENETRSQMRAIPRHTIQYTYDLQYLLTQGVFNVGYSWIRNNWAVPFWTEAQQFTGTVGQTVYPLDTTVHDIRAGGMMLLYSLAKSWQIVEVSAVTATTVTATASTLKGLLFAVPIRVGYIDGSISMNPTGYKSSAQLTFNINDVLTGLGTTAPAQYNGLDLYTDPYLIGDGDTGQTSISMQDNQVEFSVGNIAHSTPWKGSQYSKQYEYDGLGASDIRFIKDFFYRRAGKMKAFVAPTFESNLRKVSTGNVASVFKFYDDGYLSLLGTTRKTIAFCLDDGTWQLRQASSPMDVGSGVSQVNLDSALNVDASRIVYVSYAGTNRLDTDRLELNHKTAGYFTSSYQVLELTP
jgi:hypothetical protein